MTSVLRHMQRPEAIGVVTRWALALYCVYPQPAIAQETDRNRLGVRVEQNLIPDSAATKRFGQAVDTTSSRAERVARGALIGAGVGAATGLVVALVATHSSGVTDHSEDALAYISIPAFGAFIGLIIGGAVGFFRH